VWSSSSSRSRGSASAGGDIVPAEELPRLRLEDDDHTRQPKRARPRLDLRQHLPMAQMNTIEVADRCHAATMAVAQVV